MLTKMQTSWSPTALYEGGGDGGVDAAGEGAEHAAVAHLPADAQDRIGDEVAGRPVAAAAADAEDEVLDQRLPLGRVHHLRVELEADDAGVVAHDGDRGVLRVSEGAEAGGQLGNAVAVGHPDGHRAREALEDGGVRLLVDDSVTVLA